MLSSKEITDSDTLQVSCTVRNAGSIEGKEVVQLYVSDRKSRLIRPLKELKAFTKVALAPGEQTEVDFELQLRDFCYYDEAFDSWIAESGDFDLHVGASVQDIRLSGRVTLDAQRRWPVHFDERTTLREWIRYPATKEVIYPVVEDFFMQNPSEFEGDLMDFKIKDDFFLDLPMIKYVGISKGMITEQHIGKALQAASRMSVKL
ncbi:MAG: fibronectin type III-like domain-contianing protein [Arenicella sp.]|nr:fibronectin type III-like domain-contianing protein [Arenicella sp.]